MGNLSPNWDSYGAEAPNDFSKRCAIIIVEMLKSFGIRPTEVSASAEGGVAILFLDGDRYADIECLNCGEILAVTYTGKQQPIVWEVEKTDTAITDTLGRIRDHFAS